MTRRLWIVAALALCCGRAPEGQGWIASARDAQRSADDALARGDVDAARQALRGIVETAAPARVSADDRRGVVQDAAFRLARIELDEARPGAALEWTDQGLRERGIDAFTANLLIARGRAHEALGDAAAAAADYHEALQIHDALLRRALEER
jgi:predicted negative regulator of RcsB-dependent stress response